MSSTSRGLMGMMPGTSAAFAVAIERLEREAACIDFAAFFHELHDLLGKILVAGECFIAEGRGNHAVRPA